MFCQRKIFQSTQYRKWLSFPCFTCNNDGPSDYIISINGIGHACKIQNFVFKINLASVKK